MILPARAALTASLSEPETPELREGPTAHEERRSRRSSRVDREVVDRDPDQVNQRQAEADGHAREALEPALRGHAEARMPPGSGFSPRVAPPLQGDCPSR
jgi:hypothetical protein